MPPAPPTFSTIICWPSRSESDVARIRPIESIGPPAANGTTRVTGRVGQSCAARGQTQNETSAIRAAPNVLAIQFATPCLIQALLDAVLVARDVRDEAAGAQAVGKPGKSCVRHLGRPRPQTGVAVALERANQDIARDVGIEWRDNLGELIGGVLGEPVERVPGG